MTEQANGEAPVAVPDYLMLFDEAVRCGVPRKRLVDAARAGEIELLFEIPAGINAVLLPLLSQGLTPLIGSPNFMRTPEYLVLEPRYCQAMQHKSSIAVRDSKRGYRRTSGTDFLRRLEPIDADKEKMWPVSVNGVECAPLESTRWGRWGSWGLRLNGAPFDHSVNRDSLLVRASHLDRWMGWKMKDKPASFYVPRRDSSPGYNANADFISKQLMRTCEAAEIFWAGPRIIQGERDTYPSTEKIVEWFMASGVGFSSNSANAAATLITPDWANTVGRPSKKRG
jgi:hypothetical protein